MPHDRRELPRAAMFQSTIGAGKAESIDKDRKLCWPFTDESRKELAPAAQISRFVAESEFVALTTSVTRRRLVPWLYRKPGRFRSEILIGKEPQIAGRRAEGWQAWLRVRGK